MINLYPVLARRLAASLVITWPALLVTDTFPPDGRLNGKADDFATGAIVVLVIVGLLAAGWLEPLRTVLGAVVLIGIGMPVLYEALNPTECPAGVSGMDCLPGSMAAFYTLPAIVLVLLVRVIRRAAGLRAVELRSAELEPD